MYIKENERLVCNITLKTIDAIIMPMLTRSVLAIDTKANECAVIYQDWY